MSDILVGKNWVYWLDQTTPSPNNKPGSPKRYLVCIATEGETGYRKTGGDGRQPYFWDEETCRQMNEKRGFDECRTTRIVLGSMGVKDLEEK